MTAENGCEQTQWGGASWHTSSWAEEGWDTSSWAEEDWETSFWDEEAVVREAFRQEFEELDGTGTHNPTAVPAEEPAAFAVPADAKEAPDGAAEATNRTGEGENVQPIVASVQPHPTIPLPSAIPPPPARRPTGYEPTGSYTPLAPETPPPTVDLVSGFDWPDCEWVSSPDLGYMQVKTDEDPDAALQYALWLTDGVEVKVADLHAEDAFAVPADADQAADGAAEATNRTGEGENAQPIVASVQPPPAIPRASAVPPPPARRPAGCEPTGSYTPPAPNTPPPPPDYEQELGYIPYWGCMQVKTGDDPNIAVQQTMWLTGGVEAKLVPPAHPPLEAPSLNPILVPSKPCYPGPSSNSFRPESVPNEAGDVEKQCAPILPEDLQAAPSQRLPWPWSRSAEHPPLYTSHVEEVGKDVRGCKPTSTHRLRGGREGKGKGGGYKWQPGDWQCPNPICRDKQFARNTNCRKCGCARAGQAALSQLPPAASANSPSTYDDEAHQQLRQGISSAPRPPAGAPKKAAPPPTPDELLRQWYREQAKAPPKGKAPPPPIPPTMAELVERWQRNFLNSPPPKSAPSADSASSCKAQ